MAEKFENQDKKEQDQAEIGECNNWFQRCPGGDQKLESGQMFH